MAYSLTSLRRLAARLWNLPSTLLRPRRDGLLSVHPADTNGLNRSAVRDQPVLEQRRFVAEFDLLRGRALGDLHSLSVVKTRR
jgi:hypothetical protein